MEKDKIIVLWGYDNNDEYIQKPVLRRTWQELVDDAYEYRRNSDTQYLISPEGEATVKLLGCDSNKTFGEAELEKDEYIICQVIVKGEGDDTEEVKVSLLNDIVRNPNKANRWELYDEIVDDYDQEIKYFRGAFKSPGEAYEAWFEQELA